MTAAVPAPPSRDQLAEVLEEVRETVGLHQLIEEARRQERYCCAVGCGSGACETCPCCGAGWCVAGGDGLPEEPEDRATWLSIAAEHNPVAAELARVQAAASQRAVEALRGLLDVLDRINVGYVPMKLRDAMATGRAALASPAPAPRAVDGLGRALDAS